ncbi:flagellin lysine-N-methylase [Clostridium novyi]|nr:flagellin lysine-N-methylase [Clostridium novyi]
MNEYKMLTPLYTKEFKCIGSECEDSCCIGWNITIDKNTFKNYKKVINKEFKSKLEKYIKRNRHSINQYDYARIKLLDNARCPFLNNEKLCEIFIKIGEHSLSKTCTTYPRIYNKVDNILEKSLTLSCPVAARLILLNKELMEFEEVGSSENLGVIQKEINTIDELGHKNNYFWDLRIFTIDLLQNRDYSIEDRLIILGMFSSELAQNGNAMEAINKFKYRIKNHTYEDVFSEMTSKWNIKLNMIKMIIDAKMNNVIDSEFLDFYNKSIEALQYKKDNNMYEAYTLCYEKYYKKFNLSSGYIIENFLVNYVFQNMFPSGDKNIFDEYIMMIIYYSIIKVYMVGLCGYYKKEFSKEIAIKFIQKFSKCVLHDNTYANWIFDAIKENSIDTMAHMIIFIKY